MKLQAQQLKPGDLIQRTAWIEKEGNVTELRMVLSCCKVHDFIQVEWLRIKKGIVHISVYMPFDIIKVECRL
jgi:hypothetical protein